MSDTARRAEVIAMLAAYGDRRPEQVPEELDSMDQAWLIHQLEQARGRRLDLDDAVVARMSTVDGAARVLAELELDAAPGVEEPA